jgi:competence protein ComEC
VPIRIASAGDHFPYGELEIDVLHPPEEGPEGNENARSMVVLLRHAGHSILLTGDLEKQGLIDVLAKPAPKIDVLMVPHHGSPSANPPGLVHWAKPWYVVSSQEPHGRQIRWTRPFFAKGAQWLLTSRDGAVVIRSSHKELAIETHLNHQRIVMPPRGEIHGD